MVAMCQHHKNKDDVITHKGCETVDTRGGLGMFEAVRPKEGEGKGDAHTKHTVTLNLTVTVILNPQRPIVGILPFTMNLLFKAGMSAESLGASKYTLQDPLSHPGQLPFLDY